MAAAGRTEDARSHAGDCPCAAHAALCAGAQSCTAGCAADKVQCGSVVQPCCMLGCLGTAPHPCSSCMSPSTGHSHCIMWCSWGRPAAAFARLLLLLGLLAFCLAGEAAGGAGPALWQHQRDAAAALTCHGLSGRAGGAGSHHRWAAAGSVHAAGGGEPCLLLPGSPASPRCHAGVVP